MGAAGRTATPDWACSGTIAYDRRAANAAVLATAPRIARRRVVDVLMISP